MKKLTILLLTLLFGVPIGASAAYPLGVTAFGGYDMPVIQDDVGAGPLFGIGVRGNVWKLFHGELYFRSTSQGDVDEDLEFGNQTETVTYAGGTLTGFGLNLLLANKNPVNVWPYFMVGVSSNSLSPGASFKQDETLSGINGGLGTGINLYDRKIYLDVNTSLLVMPFHDNNASRKNWQTRLGVQYFFPIKTKSAS
ncbi:hypothetical protein HZB60_12240 [candidate division KSB1 bacterium]|nr:hypothetical protein [candidate division KSB1 bacterium]